MTLGERESKELVVTQHESAELVKKTSSQWAHEDLAHVKIRVMLGHLDSVNSCQFCDNDRKFLTASSDKTVILWDFLSGRSLHVYEGGHTREISKAKVNSDTSKFVSSGWDKKVNLWDAKTGQVLWTGKHGGVVMCCNYSHDDQYVVSAADLDYVVKIWDVRTGKTAFEITDLHKDVCTSVAFTPRDDRLVTTCYDNTAKFYDLRAQANTITLSGHTNVVSDASFTGDERKFVTVGYDKSICFYDISTGTYRSQGPSRIEKAHEGCLSSVDYSTDGLLLTTGGYDTSVCVWDTENCIMKLRLLGHNNWVEDVCFSGNQNWILSCSKDRSIRQWNISDCEAIPMVMEKKKAIGMKIFKCSTCGKAFSQTEDEAEGFSQECIFCRLKQDSSATQPAMSEIEISNKGPQ